MPAYTVSQLQSKLGQYVEPNGDFVAAIEQVLPRLYNLGLWRDLVFETSVPAPHGYISLPEDVDAVLGCTINDNPRPTRSMWHDIRIVGRNAELSPYFGIVDDGFHPVMLDMKEVQGVDDEEDVVPVVQLEGHQYALSDSPFNGAAFAGTITIEYEDNYQTQDSQSNTTANSDMLFDSSNDGYYRILSIKYSDVESPCFIKDPAYPTTVIAAIPKGSGVIRYRRFRVSDADENTTIHLLCKRGVPSFIDDNTIIHLGNINAIKHALLGRIAEDAADVERATYHWSVATQLLDAELDAMRGSAKPVVKLDIWGGGNRPYNIM
jgi:hypothetical protein